MKVWVLYDCDSRNGQIIGIDAVTTDSAVAEMWQRECRLYGAEQFDTDEALEYLSEVFAMNREGRKRQ